MATDIISRINYGVVQGTDWTQRTDLHFLAFEVLHMKARLSSITLMWCSVCRGHFVLSGRQPLGGGATGMWRVEVRDVAKHPTMCRQDPHNRVLWPKMPSVPNSRNPAVTKPSSLPTPLPQAAHNAPQPCQQEPADQVPGQCRVVRDASRQTHDSHREHGKMGCFNVVWKSLRQYHGFLKRRKRKHEN